MSSNQQRYYGLGILVTWIVVIGWMFFTIPTTGSPMFLPGAGTKMLSLFTNIFVAAILFFAIGLYWERFYNSMVVTVRYYIRKKKVT